MKSQLVLFEMQLRETEVGAAWGQLTSGQREIATRLLAKLMVRSVVGDNNARNEVGGKGCAASQRTANRPSTEPWRPAAERAAFP